MQLFNPFTSAVLPLVRDQTIVGYVGWLVGIEVEQQWLKNFNFVLT